MYTIENNKLLPLQGFTSQLSQRRQDVNDVFILEGSLYISFIDTYLTQKTFYHDNTLGFEMPPSRSPEIDDEVDFIIVEALMSLRFA